MTDKRMTEEDVVAELRDGMTIGIGGWGSRRKPMSIVRAILRSDLRDLTIVAYGGPEVGMLCTSGQLTKAVYGFVSLDSIPLEPHFRAARQHGTIEAMELDEGMLQWGLRAAAMRVDFLPCRAGLGSAVLDNNPGITTVASPYSSDEYLAMPAIELDVALLHANRADARGNAQYLGADWYFDDLFAMAADRTFVSCEKVVEPGDFLKEGSESTIRISRIFTDGVVEAPHGAHFTHCVPDYPRDEQIQKEYADSAKSPEAWAEFRAKYIDIPEADYRRVIGVGVMSTQATLAEICAVACAEAWRGSGEVLASPIGTIPTIGARLAALTFEPDLAYGDGDASQLAAPIPVGAPADTEKVVEAWIPFGNFFDIVWSGRRHVMMGATQIDRFGNQNIACIGPWAQPKAQLLGVRGAPGNTVNHPTSYWIPVHSTRVFVESVDCASGVGYDRATKAGPTMQQYHHIHHVVSNKGVFDFETPDHAMRIRSLHPGVTVDEVQELTGFPLVVPADVPTSRLPTDEELRIIREVLDPKGLRSAEVPD